MIALAGIVLSVFTGLLFRACLRAGGLRLPEQTAKRWSLVALGILLVALLFRPEEEIETGEDPGVYFNIAASFMTRDGFSFQDPALARINAADRILFRYGDASFMYTKANVHWSENEAMHQSEVFFYPAYSIMLALPMYAGFPYAAFWISSLLALMTGVLVAILCKWSCGSGIAGWIGFFLYVFNPVIFWNARCLRAEWPASFIALAGIVLWLAEMRRGPGGGFFQSFLAGLAISAAALFHPTALYVLIPSLALAFFQIGRTKSCAGWWCGASLGGVLIVAQWLFVTDPYFLVPRITGFASFSRILIAGIVLLLAGWILLRLVMLLQQILPSWRAGKEHITGFLMAATTLSIALYSLTLRPETGHLPGLPPWSAAYISLTDFEGLARMISRSWLFFSLAGLFFMVAGKDEARRTGRLLLLLLGPASMTIGWVFNYMFESRRMVTFLIPLITLCSVAGIFGMVKWTGWLVRRFVPSKPGLKRYIVRVLPWVMMLALLLAGARGRWHLFTTWNDKGIFDLYKEMSDRIVTEGDFLLAEYTQTAAPVESFSGLPLLPVSWGYRKQEEYRKIEEIWRDLVSSSDRERFLFISPFSGVALPGLDIEPLFSNTLETRKVGRARRSVPLEVHDKIRTVHVSRVLPPGRSTNKVEYLRLMDGSHLGLAGQANFMHNRGIVMKGVLARPGEGTEREIDVMRPGRTGTLFVMVAAPEGVDVDGLAEGGLFTPVGERWAVLRIPVDGETRDPVVLSFSSIGPVYVTDLFLLPEGAAEAIRLALPGPEVEFSLAGIHSQWLRASSAAALPVGGEAGRQLLLLATHGRDGVEEVALRVRRSGAEIKTVDETIKAGWRWHVIPLPDTGAEAAGMQWHELEVTPAWNPGLSNFPEDLGLRVAVMGTFHDLARNNSR